MGFIDLRSFQNTIMKSKIIVILNCMFHDLEFDASVRHFNFLIISDSL